MKQGGINILWIPLWESMAQRFYYQSAVEKNTEQSVVILRASLALLPIEMQTVQA